MRRLLFTPALIAIALAGASVYLAQQLGTERARAQRAETRVAGLESRLKTMERYRPIARNDNAPAPASSAAAPPVVKSPQPPAADSGATGKPVESRGNPQAQMLRTPSSRALVLADRIARLKSQHSDLARVLGMSDAEAQEFLEFVADQQLRRELAFAKNRRNGSFDFSQLTAEQNGELEARLGKERLRKYETYRKGAPDRSQVRSFRARLGDADTLTDAQAESLATALQEEREQYAREITDQFGGGATFTMQSVNGRSLMTNNPASDEDAQERQLIEQVEMYNRRAHDRAGALLSPGQLQAFEEFLAAQLASDRVMLRSMRDTQPTK